MRVLNRIYTLYFAVVFIVTFLLLCVPFFLISQKKVWNKYVSFLNKIWLYITFTLVFLPIKVRYESKLKSNDNYIFCPNHFSYFDIPSLALTPTFVQFVGMSELTKIPLFGYFFRKLHIVVDRKSVRSGVKAFKQSLQALKEGRSLIFFPEGGIKTTKAPVLAEFKMGAFQLSAETGVPIVPVTLLSNWLFMPDDGCFLMHWRKIEVVYHQPIYPKGLRAEELKEKVFEVIEKELKNQLL